MKFKQGPAHAPQEDGEGKKAPQTPEKLEKRVERFDKALEAGKEALLKLDELGPRNVIEWVEIPDRSEMGFSVLIRASLATIMKKAPKSEQKALSYILRMTDILARPTVRDKFKEHREQNDNSIDAKLSKEEAFKRYEESPLLLSRSQWERFILMRDTDDPHLAELQQTARAFVDSNRLGLNIPAAILTILQNMLPLYLPYLDEGSPLRKIDFSSFDERAQEKWRSKLTPEKYEPLSHSEKLKAMEGFEALIKELLIKIVKAYG